MTFEEIVSSAINALKLNKVRSFLTMLGVIIGVFSVVVLVSIVTGVKNYVTGQFNSLGSNLLFISPGKLNLAGDPAKMYSNNKLSSKQVEDIRLFSDKYVKYITPYVEMYKTAYYKNKNMLVNIVGGSYETPKIFTVELAAGRFYTQAEEQDKAKVIIIGSEVRSKLFGEADPIGESIKVGDEKVQIIGITKPKGENWDTSVYMSPELAMDLYSIKNYSSLAAVYVDGVTADEAQKSLELSLLRTLKKDEFTVLTQADLLTSVNSILNMLSFVLIAIAAISLFVGGIGIMNIMLVSVNERISEIGLRKALGATGKSISLQFLVEAVLLSVIGGIIGVILSFLLSLVINKYIQTSIPLWAIGLALGFSLLVGVLFGTYPAYQASKKDPIEALRYE